MMDSDWCIVGSMVTDMTLDVKEISTLINTNKTDIWREHIEKLWDHRRNTSIYWNTIHGLAQKRPTQQDNNSITFKDNTHMNHKDIASAFNKQFINTIPRKTNTTNRKITRKILKLHPTYHNRSSPSRNQQQQEQQLYMARQHQ